MDIDRGRARALGVYVLLLAVCQFALYVASARGLVGADRAFELDPRVGFAFWRAGGGAGRPEGSLLAWLAGGWLLSMGAVLVAGYRAATVYAVSEAVLSLPSLSAFVFTWALSRTSLAEGSSVQVPLRIPLVVFAVFSVVPIVWACLSLRRPPGEISSGVD